MWNIPYARNRNFTGRDSLLKEIREVLVAGRAAALVQAIVGLGGVGKTQLATEYAYRHAGEYDAVWWVRSEEPSTLASDYANLARELGLLEKEEQNQTVIVEAVRRWLGGKGRWLLVFDNAREAKDIADYLPQGGGGHVLITSRNPGWRGVGNVLGVEPFERGASVEFLMKRTGKADEAGAAELAEALGDLPLALEQAGAYIEETGQSFSGYLALFESRRQELLRRGVLSTKYPDTVATTWELSFQGAGEVSAAGAGLMDLCAFLAPDDIPLDVVRGGVEYLPKGLAEAVADPLKFDEAVAALRRYSLVKVGDDTVSVHRLVQAVGRDRLSEEEQKVWAEAAVRVVDKAFPDESDDVRTWPECGRLLDHALLSAGHAEELEVAPERNGRLLNQVGLYLQERAQYAEAKFTLERALAISEAAYGPNHPAVAIRVNNLGLVLKDLGDLEGARVHYERALTIDIASYGPNHHTVARIVNNLGIVLQAMGDLEGARKHSEQSLAISEAFYGPDHPNVAISANNLGTVLKALGDVEGARKHIERALAISEAFYGPDHPNVARSAWSLAAVLYAMGDKEGARLHYERTLRIFQKFLGESHPDTVGVRKDLERLDKAEPR